MSPAGKSLALALSLCLLPGCASQGSGVSGTISGDEASFFSRSGWLSCVGGALVGATAGLFACRDHNENPLVCALAGIGVGCAVGMGTNYALDYVRDHYRNREQQLEAVAKELKADNDRARSFATATQKLLDEERLELRRLEADLQAGAVSQDRLGEKLRGMDANIEYMQGNIAKAKERLRTHEQIRSELLEGADERQLARIDGEIASLRDSIAQMEANLDEYSQQRNALKVRS